MRISAIFGVAFVFASTLQSQVVERPVAFDNARQVMVMTHYIAERAALRAPWWPVSGDFSEARLYTVNDSSYVLTVARRNGVEVWIVSDLNRPELEDFARMVIPAR